MLEGSVELAWHLEDKGRVGIWGPLGRLAALQTASVEKRQGTVYYTGCWALASSHQETSKCLLAPQPVTAATHWHHLHFKPAGDRVLRDKPVTFAE